MKTISGSSCLKAGVHWKLRVPSTRRTWVPYAFDSQMLALPYSLCSENKVGGKIPFGNAFSCAIAVAISSQKLIWSRTSLVIKLKESEPQVLHKIALCIQP